MLHNLSLCLWGIKSGIFHNKSCYHSLKTLSVIACIVFAITACYKGVFYANFVCCYMLYEAVHLIFGVEGYKYIIWQRNVSTCYFFILLTLEVDTLRQSAHKTDFK